MNATLRISTSDVRKELSIQDDKTESDNRIEVTILKEIVENNLSHTVRCKSTKSPYAERHVWWCERSINLKVGGNNIYLLPNSPCLKLPRIESIFQLLLLNNVNSYLRVIIL